LGRSDNPAVWNPGPRPADIADELTEAIREIRSAALSAVGGDDRLVGEQNQRRREALAHIIEITNRTLGGGCDKPAR